MKIKRDKADVQQFWKKQLDQTSNFARLEKPSTASLSVSMEKLQA